jgi:hypothetical protein
MREREMSSKSDLLGGAALAALPLAAFLVGPVLDEAVAPENVPSDLLNSVLPTVLPLGAPVVVAVVSYRRTGSAARALRHTALAFAVTVLGAVAYLSMSGWRHLGRERFRSGDIPARGPIGGCAR